MSNAIVYNYEKGYWGVWDSIDLVDACISDGKLTLLRDDWEVWQQSDRWSHPNSANGQNLLLLRTPWLNIGDIPNLGRIRRVRILGRHKSSNDTANSEYPSDTEISNLRVTLRYDYDPANADVVEWTGTEIVAEPAAGNRNNFIREVRCGTQRAHAIQVEIEEYTAGSGTVDPQGFEITALNLVVGVKSPRARNFSAERVK